MKWEPAIYEHKAALINKSPVEVANSAELLAEAVLKEYEIYQADYITVGLDVYNIEAEALGTEITVPSENECPDLTGLLYDLNSMPEQLGLPPIPESGRFQLLIDAAKKVKDAIETKTAVRVAASGPVSMATKLARLEDLVMSLCMEDGKAEKLLEFTTQIVEKWCACLRDNDLDVIIFDSMVSPPMFSPDMYENIVLPLHKLLMSQLKQSGQSERELVIGGNTSKIANLMKQTGANIILCDYASDATTFKANLGYDTDIQVRRNINPALLTESNNKELSEKFQQELTLFTNPIAGTGILPYNFISKNLLNFMYNIELIVKVYQNELNLKTERKFT